MRIVVVAALVAAVVALGACRGGAKAGAPCSQVAGRLFALARDELAKAPVDPETRRLVADQLPAMRDAIGQQCQERGWTPQVRDCMAQAADHLAFEACERQLGEAQRAALDRATRSETGSP